MKHVAILIVAAVAVAAPGSAEASGCKKPKGAGVHRAYSNQYGVLYRKLLRNEDDATNWYGCSYRFGRTFELGASDRGAEVSATVRPEFIRLRFEGYTDGCNRASIFAGGWSMVTGRENELFVSTCDETSGDRKYRTRRFEKIVQRKE